MKNLGPGKYAALTMILPLLMGCQKAPVDAALRQPSTIQEEQRQQEIQREMEQQQRAAEMQRVQQMVPPMGMPH